MGYEKVFLRRGIISLNTTEKEKINELRMCVKKLEKEQIEN